MKHVETWFREIKHKDFQFLVEKGIDDDTGMYFVAIEIIVNDIRFMEILNQQTRADRDRVFEEVSEDDCVELLREINSQFDSDKQTWYN